MRVGATLRAKHGRVVAIRKAESVGVPVVKNGCGTEGDMSLGAPSGRDMLSFVIAAGFPALARA